MQTKPFNKNLLIVLLIAAFLAMYCAFVIGWTDARSQTVSEFTFLPIVVKPLRPTPTLAPYYGVFRPTPTPAPTMIP